MTDWESTLPHVWSLPGLPDDPGTNGKVYDFRVGHLDYIIPVGKMDFYLTIPEYPARDAEGRPQFPEQEAWINRVIAAQRINARCIWWSHWQFSTNEDAIAFENLLRDLGAKMRV